jgi:hypothetical protein
MVDNDLCAHGVLFVSVQDILSTTSRYLLPVPNMSRQLKSDDQKRPQEVLLPEDLKSTNANNLIYTRLVTFPSRKISGSYGLAFLDKILTKRGTCTLMQVKTNGACAESAQAPN